MKNLKSMRQPSQASPVCSPGPESSGRDHEAHIQQILAILPGQPVPYAGKIADKQPAAERYVPFATATWADLQGFLHDRSARVSWARGGAKARLLQWKEDLRSKMQVLAPYMADNPGMTVLEACQHLQHARTAHDEAPH